MSVEAWSSLILEGSEGKTLPGLLTALLDLGAMKKLATAHGLVAKGFRVEKASTKQLAPLLVKQSGKNEALREGLAKALHESRVIVETKDSGGASQAQRVDSAEWKALELRLRKAEKRSQREAESAKKARASRQKSLREQASQARETAELHGDLSRLTKECESLRQSLEEQTAMDPEAAVRSSAMVEREMQKLHERVEDLEEQDRTNRLAEAESMTRIRELEALVQELDSLLPRGQRERIKQFNKSLVEPRTSPGLLPVYGRDFLDSLERLPDPEKLRVHAALAQVVLGGLDQPGLRVKALKGRGDLLSLRAGIHYRVYFSRSADKIQLHHVGTREEQETFLKNWRA